MATKRKRKEVDPSRSRGRNRVTGEMLPSADVAMERLRRGWGLLQAASRALPETIERTEGRAPDLHGEWLPAQVAKYAQALELHYEYAMAAGELDRAIQCMMVLLKYSVSCFLGGKPARLPSRKEMGIEIDDAEVANLSDEEIDRELKANGGTDASA